MVLVSLTAVAYCCLRAVTVRCSRCLCSTSLLALFACAARLAPTIAAVTRAFRPARARLFLLDAALCGAAAFRLISFRCDRVRWTPNSFRFCSGLLPIPHKPGPWCSLSNPHARPIESGALSASGEPLACTRPPHQTCLLQEGSSLPPGCCRQPPVVTASPATPPARASLFLADQDGRALGSRCRR